MRWVLRRKKRVLNHIEKELWKGIIVNMKKSSPIAYHTVELDTPWEKRPFHWSQISSWDYDPEQWYRTYYLGIKQPLSKELLFGKKVDDKIQDDPTFIPELERYPTQQHSMSVMYNGVKLNGTADHFCRKTKRLKDDKTGKKKWDQKRADETGQLTMYLFLIYISEKIKPEEMTCYIDWLPTVDRGDFTIQFRDDPPKPVTFKTKRTMKDLLNFGAHINSVRKEMLAYVNEHK